MTSRTNHHEYKTSHDRVCELDPLENSRRTEGDVCPQSRSLAFTKYTSPYLLVGLIYTPLLLFCVFCVALLLLM